jgi:hypothetical protein
MGNANKNQESNFTSTLNFSSKKFLKINTEKILHLNSIIQAQLILEWK